MLKALKFNVFARYLIFSECNNRFLAYSQKTDPNLCHDFLKI